MTFPQDWDELTCINYLQRWVLVHSILYYEFDKNAVSDFVYDKNAHQLADMMQKCKNVQDSRYYYVFYDFEGSTGCHLKNRLNDADRDLIMSIVDYGIKHY